MIGVLKYKWTFCAYEFSCFSQVPEELVVSSIVANWELTVLKEKALFCQTKNPKRSRLPETLHLCEVAKEHFFFPDENHSKLWRTSVCEVESMSRNWDSFIELGLRSCFSHKWCPHTCPVQIATCPYQHTARQCFSMHLSHPSSSGVVLRMQQRGVLSLTFLT